MAKHLFIVIWLFSTVLTMALAGYIQLTHGLYEMNPCILWLQMIPYIQSIISYIEWLRSSKAIVDKLCIFIFYILEAHRLILFFRLDSIFDFTLALRN